ncbi:MAG: hypothetical protein CR994_06655 [Maribacter sp.]|nr:MAG: hypothetical protein CR994_06655 [Maribacter sp.]
MTILKAGLKKSLLVLGVAITFVCCKEKKETAKESIAKDSIESVVYELEIEKLNCTENKKDVAALFFEGGFSDDSVQVFVNNKKVFADKITTDRSLGAAMEVELGKLSMITDLTIRINNSQKMDILNKTCSFTFVNFIDDRVTVKYDSIFVPYN